MIWYWILYRFMTFCKIQLHLLLNRNRSFYGRFQNYSLPCRFSECLHCSLLSITLTKTNRSHLLILWYSIHLGREWTLWTSVWIINDRMTRDGEIPAIFNPKRVRTPSVVVTGDSSSNGPFNPSGNNNNSSSGVAPGGVASSSGVVSVTIGSCGFSNVLTSSNPQITHQDSISSSQQDPNEVITIQADTPPGTHGSQHNFGVGIGAGGDSSDTQTGQLAAIDQQHQQQPQQPNGQAGEDAEVRFRKLKACHESCCSELAKKVSGELARSVWTCPP